MLVRAACSAARPSGCPLPPRCEPAAAAEWGEVGCWERTRREWMAATRSGPAPSLCHSQDPVAVLACTACRSQNLLQLRRHRLVLPQAVAKARERLPQEVAGQHGRAGDVLSGQWGGGLQATAAGWPQHVGRGWKPASHPATAAPAACPRTRLCRLAPGVGPLERVQRRLSGAHEVQDRLAQGSRRLQVRLGDAAQGRDGPAQAARLRLHIRAARGSGVRAEEGGAKWAGSAPASVQAAPPHLGRLQLLLGPAGAGQTRVGVQLSTLLAALHHHFPATTQGGQTATPR